jgi:hypothetical protein
MAVTISSSGRRGAKTYEIRWKNGELYHYTDTLADARRSAAEARKKERAYYRGNPGGRRTTKAKRKQATRKSAGARRVAAALKKFVRSNPALPAAFRKAKALGIRRNAGGKSVTIRVIPIKGLKA